MITIEDPVETAMIKPKKADFLKYKIDG